MVYVNIVSELLALGARWLPRKEVISSAGGRAREWSRLFVPGSMVPYVLGSVVSYVSGQWYLQSELWLIMQHHHDHMTCDTKIQESIHIKLEFIA